MKRPAVFFDRDNTLIISDGYLGDPSQVRLVDGAADAVARVRHLGFATVVISNQSGVARGMFDEAAVQAVNARLDEILKHQNAAAVIDRHEYCPFHPEATVDAYRADSEMRKPRPGMLLQAAEKMALDVSRSWVVGDAPRDIAAGHAAGCRTILLRDPVLLPSPAAEEDLGTVPDFIVVSLHEATETIASHRTSPGELLEAARSNSEPVSEFAAAAAGASIAPRADVAPATAAGPDAPSVELRTKPVAPTATTDKAGSSRVAGVSSTRLETLAEQILHELRRRNEQTHGDFSVSKLMAGVVQVVALATLIFAYLERDTPSTLVATLLLGIFLQALTISLLVMGRQR